MRQTRYYITRKDLDSGTQDESGIPKGTLVKGQWDDDSYFRVKIAPFRRKMNQAYSAALPSGDTREYLRKITDDEIERGLKAIGILED